MVRSRSAQQWLNIVVAALALWSTLAYAFIWASSYWGNPHHAGFQMSLTGGRSLHVRLWPIVALGVNPTASRPTVRQTVDALWLGVWYQRRPHGRLFPIATTPIRTWPLIVLGGGSAACWLALAGWGVQRRRHRVNTCRALAH